MQTFMTWEVPGDVAPPDREAFTFLARSARDRAKRRVVDAPFPWRGRWPTSWVGEIKPHTASGIAAGKRQLAKRAEPNKVLVTYRRLAPDQVEVLAAIAPNWDAWYVLGRRQFDWKRPVPLDSCTACLGQHVEGTVRAVVRTMAPTLAPKRSARTIGPDLSPELEEELAFLGELVAELAAMVDP